MLEQTSLIANKNFPAWSACATMQVRPGNDVAAEPSPALKYLRLMNPLCWSADNFSRVAVITKFLLELVDRFMNRS